MIKRTLIFLSVCSLFSCTSNHRSVDICIYGGTSAGVVAGVSASRLGKKTIIIEPTAHLGGLSSSGLGSTDIGNKHAVTGIARDFYRRMGKYYGIFEAWTFEPSVAEKTFEQYINESNVKVLRHYRLVSVEKSDNVIRQITVERPLKNGKTKIITIQAKMFIDCSYEGDLMAGAGVEYTVGREPNSQYNETINGFQIMDGHQFPDSISPYKAAGDSTSGLLWGIGDGPAVAAGTGDKRVQAYNYRLCWTNDSANRIPFSATKPANYDPDHYELLLRVMLRNAADTAIKKHDVHKYFIVVPMPNSKTDVNNRGPFSTDFIGMNYSYPEAGYSERDSIAKAHTDYIKGLCYFISTDPRVPASVQESMNEYGWAKDEFTDNDHFPHQLYVREARRMIGEYVMTEHNCVGDSMVADAVGLAAYTMDSHNCQRLVINGMVKNEGNVEVGQFPPYPISYRSLTPKRSQCTNLLVPVCLSASHIAYGSIRMEPVYMVLAQVSATAASLAIDNNIMVQQVDVTKLMSIMNNNPLLNGTLPDIVADNADSTLVDTAGPWQTASRFMHQYKHNYFWIQPSDTNYHIVFNIPVTATAKYMLYYYLPHVSKKITFASSVTVSVTTSAKEYKTRLTLQRSDENWNAITGCSLKQGETIQIKIHPLSTDSAIFADCILLVPQSR